ncbi:T-cell-specific surface glycoprotein CD28 [Cyprinodon tularosa]|uniref:T-cell-specific surface glycoprotein CD28 n=1 Tax=Cyprinodon tularosa TaxID=77115 RepID=UPI0018E28522|nr:T-cell-specific surface glycoprotein CD28 [Cyprinodon tularosa]
MFLNHSMMGWTVLAVLSITVPVWSSMKVIQSYRTVSTNGTAQIHCFIRHQMSLTKTHPRQVPANPFSQLEDLQVTLLRGLHGSERVCSSVLNISKQQIKTQQEKDGDVECAIQIKDGALEVALSGLKATHTDIYRCEIQIFYPPPFLQLTGNGTLLHVLESANCPLRGPQRQQGQEDEEVRKEPLSVPVVLLVIVIICVLVIITTLQALQWKQGRREPIRMPPNLLLHKVDAVPFSSGNML